MLLEIEISNYALIEKEKIQFKEGLNIITGETGAGKSIVIDSIKAVLGNRITREEVRTGCDKAYVSAVFSYDNKEVDRLLDDLGFEKDDNQVILSRKILSTGKSICRINGMQAPAGSLKALGNMLVDIHGQFDSRLLADVSQHINLLDSYGGEDIGILLKIYKALLAEKNKISKKINELGGDEKQRKEKADYIKYQIDEIEKADLKEDEENELAEKRNILENSEKIMNVLASSYGILFGEKNYQGKNAQEIINDASNNFITITDLSERYEEIHKRLNNISYEMDDISYEIRGMIDKMDFNPKMLELTEARLDTINRMKKKYQKSVSELLLYKDTLIKEYDEFISSEKIIKKLNNEIILIEKKLEKAALNLSEKRKKTAASIEKEIIKQLKELEMNDAGFKIFFKNDNNIKYMENGIDDIEFLISPNKGEPLKPLSKIASGGEIARVMLAVKSILAERDRLMTMIFDEIDSGISGITAQKTGDKLKKLSKMNQVICVTHHAAIAAKADAHFLITKTTRNERTNTNVKCLEKDEKINEISRLISGNAAFKTSVSHAKELLKKEQ